MTEESNKDTQIQIGSLKNQYESNKQELLQRIITLVCDIKPEAHINARIQWREQAKPTHFHLISFVLIIPLSHSVVELYLFIHFKLHFHFFLESNVRCLSYSIKYIYLSISIYLPSVYCNWNKISSLENVNECLKRSETYKDRVRSSCVEEFYEKMTVWQLKRESVECGHFQIASVKRDIGKTCCDSIRVVHGRWFQCAEWCCSDDTSTTALKAFENQVPMT